LICLLTLVVQRLISRMLCGDSFFVPLWNFKLPFSVLLYYQIQSVKK
jgi:hypothetical protein